MAKILSKIFSRNKGIDSSTKDLTDPETLASVIDPFDISAPFQEDLSNTSVKNHVWVQIAVNIIMRCIMRSDYVLSVDGMQHPTVFDHIFDSRGGNTPAKTLFMKAAMWWGWEGEFFFYWERGYRLPEEIHVLDPRRVMHRVDDNGEVSYFFKDYAHNIIPLTKDNSLHIMMPNVYMRERGVFPLFSAGIPALKQDRLINAGNLDALKNGAIPDVVLAAKQRITEQQSKDAIRMWNNAYSRNNGGSRVAVLGNNMSVEQLSADLIKYIDLLDWNRTTILAMYGVPLKVANAETGKTALSGKDSNEQYRALFSQTIVPTLDFWAGEINRQFFSALGHPEVTGEFSLEKVAELQEDENKLSQRENADIKAGKVTINEVRARHGLEPLPWGDEWHEINGKGESNDTSQITES
jgi:HK97 family phage portal protein